MNQDDLIAQLENCTLPEDRFHHADHLHAAWLYLTRFPASEAMARYSKALRSYTASLGKASRYHETITWAYLFLLNERILRSEPAAAWEQFAAAHPDLLDWKNSILLRYYRPETLKSDLARQVFLMPDRYYVAERAKDTDEPLAKLMFGARSTLKPSGKRKRPKISASNSARR